MSEIRLPIPTQDGVFAFSERVARPTEQKTLVLGFGSTQLRLVLGANVYVACPPALATSDCGKISFSNRLSRGISATRPRARRGSRIQPHPNATPRIWLHGSLEFCLVFGSADSVDWG